MKSKTWVYGITGRTGSHIPEAIKLSKKLDFLGGCGSVFKSGSLLDQKVEPQSLSAELQETAAIIDFSTPQANALLFDAIKQGGLKNKALLIATTSLSKEKLADWQKLAEEQSWRILLAPNTSLGVLVMSKVCEQLAAVMDQSGFDTDLIEWHHKHKKDAPGGTTKMLVDRILAGEGSKKKAKEVAYHVDGERPEDTVSVQVLRSGNVFGEHSVYFTSEDEQVSLTHRAFSRKLFAKGAVQLTEWLLQKDTGFYTLESVELKELLHG